MKLIPKEVQIALTVAWILFCLWSIMVPFLVINGIIPPANEISLDFINQVFGIK